MSNFKYILGTIPFGLFLVFLIFVNQGSEVGDTVAKGLQNRITSIPLGADTQGEDSSLIKSPSSEGTIRNKLLDLEMKLQNGQEHLSAGQYELARSIFLDILETSPTLSIRDSTVSLTHCLLAEVAIRTGQFERATSRLHDCALSMPRNFKAQEFIEPYYHHNLGFLQHSLGRYDAALEHYELALSKYPPTEQFRDYRYSNTLNNIGNIYYRLGLSKKAEETHKLNLSLRLSIFPDDHPKIAGTLGNLGNVYYAEGRHDKALEYHYRSLAIWKRQAHLDSVSIALTYDNIGMSYSKLNDVGSALLFLDESLAIKNKIMIINHPSKATTYYHLGVALFERGDITTAKSSISRSLEILQANSISKTPLHTLAISAQALIQAETESISIALETIDSHLTQIKEQNHLVLATLLNQKARICLKASLFDCAASAAHEAIYINAGGVNISNERFTPIRLDFKDPEQLLASIQLKGDALYLRGKVADQLDDVHASFETYEQGIRLISRLFRTDTHFAQNYLENYRQSISNSGLMVGLQLHGETGDEKILHRMFSIVDDTRSSGVIDLGIRNLSDSRERPEITERSQMHPLSSAIGSSTVKSLSTLAYTHTPFATILDSFNRPETSLIEYFTIDDGHYAFVLNDGTLYLKILGDTNNIMSTISKLDSANKESRSKDILHYSFEVYRLVLEPLLGIIHNDDIIVIPSKELSTTSFEALTTFPMDTTEDYILYHDFPFLIKDRGISYGYSASLLLMQSNRETFRYESDMLAFAPVFDFQSDYSQQVVDFISHNSVQLAANDKELLPPLPGSALEVKAIASILKWKDGWKGLFTSNPSDVLLREESTEHRLKTTDLTQYRYLHFATHSFADTNNPADSGIILETSGSNGEDGILHAHEIFDLNLNAELVVLSSCDTAKDAANDNSGLSGFAKGFIYAGARNLVASLWPSDDVGTQILMQEFYRELAKGLPSDVALRNAKLNLINTKGPIAKPYYWSGFIHIGAPGSS